MDPALDPAPAPAPVGSSATAEDISSARVEDPLIPVPGERILVLEQERKPLKRIPGLRPLLDEANKAEAMAKRAAARKGSKNQKKEAAPPCAVRHHGVQSWRSIDGKKARELFLFHVQHRLGRVHLALQPYRHGRLALRAIAIGLARVRAPFPALVMLRAGWEG